MREQLKALVDNFDREYDESDTPQSDLVEKILESLKELLKPPAKGPTFIWFCKRCGKEYEWEISKLSHSVFGADSCLACFVKSGDRVPFNSSNCPSCKGLTNSTKYDTLST